MKRQVRKGEQIKFELKEHGGKRTGAGRPNKSGLQAHVKRPEFRGKVPGHVTLRVVSGLPSLRRPDIFRLFRLAVLKSKRLGFGVAHYNVLSNHIHLILEPGHEDLAKLLQSLCISFAKRLNAKLNRSGRVFVDRYHIHVLKTPTETKRALTYVLTNDSKHFDKTNGLVGKRPPIVLLDQFSSAFSFREWKTLFRVRVEFVSSNWRDEDLQAWHREILTPPRSWLLQQGWKRAA
jgi:hypothetical protein